MSLIPRLIQTVPYPFQALPSTPRTQGNHGDHGGDDSDGSDDTSGPPSLQTRPPPSDSSSSSESEQGQRSEPWAHSSQSRREAPSADPDSSDPGSSHSGSRRSRSLHDSRRSRRHRPSQTTDWLALVTSAITQLGDQSKITAFQATYMTVRQGVKIAPLRGTSPSHMLNWHVFVGQALQHAAWVVNGSPIHEFTET